jgi:isoquinoline 1-oxidoreductase beta subunit
VISVCCGTIVEQSKFDDYEPTRVREMPKMEVCIMKSTAAPSGIGEPGVATTGAGDR